MQTDVKSRLRRLIESRGMTIKEFSNATGIPYATVLNYLQGTRRPTSENLHKIAMRLKCNLNWLLTGEGEMFENSREHGGNRDGDYVYVPYFEGRVGAGKGLIPAMNAEIRLAFRREWIVRFGDPRNMSLIKVEGDSMEPTLISGDIILVDHSRNYVSPQGGIYVVTVGEEVMVKRLHMDYSTGKIKVISDNRLYPSFDLSPDQITINGKVIWYGRTLER